MVSTNPGVQRNNWEQDLDVRGEIKVETRLLV
jgi:hypothetical protein